METIHLSKPLKVKGEEVQDVVLDFDKLTGKDIIAAETQARAVGESVVPIYSSMRYQGIIAAKILGVKMDDIEELPSKDYINLITPIANFFFKAG